MPLLAPFWATCWPSGSGCGGSDRFKFVRCVDGRDPEVQKVWIWGDDRITPEVHTTAQIDVNPWITYDLADNYFTETGSMTNIFVKKSINGSFEFLGFADPLRIRRPYWIENILCTSLCWEVRGTVKFFNSGSQPGGSYSSVDVPWRGSDPARPAYLPRSP